MDFINFKNHHPDSVDEIMSQLSLSFVVNPQKKGIIKLGAIIEALLEYKYR